MDESYFKRNRLRIVCIVVFLIPLIGAGTRRTLDQVNNDVSDWLPDSFQETADYAWFMEHFPNEQFILISWEGCTLDDPRLDEFAERLVPTVSTEEGGESGSENGQVFRSVTTGPRLIAELQNRYSRSTSLTEAQIMNRLKGSLLNWEEEDPANPYDWTTRRPESVQTCIFVTVDREAVKGKELKETLEQVRQIAREVGAPDNPIEPPEEEPESNLIVRAAGAFKLAVSEIVFGRNPTTDGVILGGPPVDNDAINIEGEYTLWRLAGFCAMISIGLAMLCLHSLRLTMMVFWIALLGAGMAIASVFFTGQTCDAVLLSMPALVLVLGMSGAIHIVNYYHDAIAESGLEGAPGRAVKHALFPCTMASLTTALGLGSLCVSNVLPISKFGVYSAIGVLATLPLLFLYLPSLLSYFPSRKFAQLHAGAGIQEPKETRILRFWRWLGGHVIEHNIAVSLTCGAIMIVLAFGLGKIKTSVKLMELFSKDAEIIAHYKWMEGQIGPLTPMEILLRFDNVDCDLSTSDRMMLVEEIGVAIEQELGDSVGGAFSAATMAPPLDSLTRGGLLDSFRQTAMNTTLDGSRPQLREYIAVDRDVSLSELGIDPVVLEQLNDSKLYSLKDVERRDRSLPLAGFEAESEELAEVDALIRIWQDQNGEDLWRISTRVWSLKKDIDYAIFVNDLERVVTPTVQGYLKRNGYVPRDYEFPDEYKFESGTENPPCGVTVSYTGLVPLVYKTQHVLLSSLTSSLLTAFILICVVMMIVLKSPSAGLLSMIPNMFPVIIIFGFMGWSHELFALFNRPGILVDIGTMMTSTVALGVAVDDTMHFLTWFRDGLDRGMTRKEAAMLAYERCASAMTQTTLIGGLGLASFALSTFTPTQRFGVLMLALLFVALAGDLIFLPSLLTGPLGRIFDPNKSKKKKKRKLSLQEKALDDAVSEDQADPSSMEAEVDSDKPSKEQRETQPPLEIEPPLKEPLKSTPELKLAPTAISPTESDSGGSGSGIDAAGLLDESKSAAPHDRGNEESATTGSDMLSSSARRRRRRGKKKQGAGSNGRNSSSEGKTPSSNGTVDSKNSEIASRNGSNSGSSREGTDQSPSIEGHAGRNGSVAEANGGAPSSSPATGSSNNGSNSSRKRRRRKRKRRPSASPPNNSSK
jgi:uncharacterized protein